MLPDERLQANLKGLLPLIYMIPSYAAHVVVLTAILSRRNKEELGTNFYRLYAFSSITALSSSIFSFIYNRARFTPCLVPIFQALPDRSWYLSLLNIMYFYFIYVDLLISLTLNFNRASVVLLKAHYQRFWRTYLIPIMALFYLIPALIVFKMWYGDISKMLANPLDPDEGYDWKERDPISVKNSVIMLVVVLATAFGSVASNLYVIVYLIFSAKEKKSFAEAQKGNKDAQKRLFIFTSTTLISYLAYAVMQVLFTYIKDKPTIYLMLGIQAYIIDCMNCSPPWFLLFISPQVRRCVLRMRVIHEVSVIVKISQGHVVANQKPFITTSRSTTNPIRVTG